MYNNMPKKSRRQQKGGVWPFDTDTDTTACVDAKEVEKTEVAAAASKRELACKPVETLGGRRRRKTASKRASKKRKSRKSRK